MILIETLFAALIVGTAGYIFYKSIKKKTKGQCDCGSCSQHCPMYEETHKKK